MKYEASLALFTVSNFWLVNYLYILQADTYTREASWIKLSRSENHDLQFSDFHRHFIRDQLCPVELHNLDTSNSYIIYYCLS